MTVCHRWIHHQGAGSVGGLFMIAVKYKLLFWSNNIHSLSPPPSLFLLVALYVIMFFVSRASGRMGAPQCHQGDNWVSVSVLISPDWTWLCLVVAYLGVLVWRTVGLGTKAWLICMALGWIKSNLQLFYFTNQLIQCLCYLFSTIRMDSSVWDPNNLVLNTWDILVYSLSVQVECVLKNLLM